MRKWLLALSVMFFGAALIATDADARRLGGGRSIAAQPSVTPPPATTPAKPAQPQQAAQQPPSRWGMLGGILGGLALGGLLGYLFGGSGLLGFLLLAALAVAIVLAIRAVAARRQERPRPVQFAGLGNETVAAPPASHPQPLSVPSPSRVPA